MAKMTFEEWRDEYTKKHGPNVGAQEGWDACAAELERDQSAREAAAGKEVEEKIKYHLCENCISTINWEFEGGVHVSGTSALDDLLREARRAEAEWWATNDDYHTGKVVGCKWCERLAELRSAPRTEPR